MSAALLTVAKIRSQLSADERVNKIRDLCMKLSDLREHQNSAICHSVRVSCRVKQSDPETQILESSPTHGLRRNPAAEATSGTVDAEVGWWAEERGGGGVKGQNLRRSHMGVCPL